MQSILQWAREGHRLNLAEAKGYGHTWNSAFYITFSDIPCALRWHNREKTAAREHCAILHFLLVREITWVRNWAGWANVFIATCFGVQPLPRWSRSPGAVNPCSPPGTAAPALVPQQRPCQMVLRLEQRFITALGGSPGRLGVPVTALGGSPGAAQPFLDVAARAGLSLVPSQPGLQRHLPSTLVPSAAAGPGWDGERGRGSCGSCRASQAMKIGNPAGDSCFR